MSRGMLRRVAALGIRGRLALLAVALGLPILGYIAYARMVAARLDDYVGDVDQLLATLSRVVPATPDATARNDALLSDLRPNLPSHVSNLAIWDTAGENVGVLDPVLRTHPFTVADRDYFRGALEGQSLVVEAPLVSRGSGEAMAIFARSVIRNGRAVGVVAASTKLRQLESLLRPEGTLPAGSVITILDQRGVVLARSLE